MRLEENKENQDKTVDYKASQPEADNQQIVIMGGAIAGLNLLLMVFVSMYWTNPDFHSLMTGKPL